MKTEQQVSDLVDGIQELAMMCKFTPNEFYAILLTMVAVLDGMDELNKD